MHLEVGAILENKLALIRMFNSEEWKASRSSSSSEGKAIEDVVMDKIFWKNIVICLKGAYPLMKVLRIVDSDEKPAMGFIYEEMDQAKERIANAFHGVQKLYQPVWDVIDNRWDKQLHRPLHAAGYYLNPQFHYSPTFKADYEVKRGLYDCLERMSGGDIDVISKIDSQLEDFKNRKKFFGSIVAKAGVNVKSPAAWWDSYGEEHSELQNFAIRVLSLTCSSSGCERNWSAFERVHTKKRNRLQQKTMNDVIFVMANSRLSHNKLQKTQGYNFDDIQSDNEWIVGDEDDEDLEKGDAEDIAADEDYNFDFDIDFDQVAAHIGGTEDLQIEEGDEEDPLSDLDLTLNDLF